MAETDPRKLVRVRETKQITFLSFFFFFNMRPIATRQTKLKEIIKRKRNNILRRYHSPPGTDAASLYHFRRLVT